MDESSGASPNHMRWDLGDAQIYRQPHRANSSPVDMDANPWEGVAWDQVTGHDGVVEDLTVHRDTGLATQGNNPGMDHTPLQDARLVTGMCRDNAGGKDPHHIHCHRVPRMTGTPTSQSWMMWVGGGVKGRSADKTPRWNMSGSSSGGFMRGSRRWSDRTSSMRQPIRVSRTL